MTCTLFWWPILPQFSVFCGLRNFHFYFLYNSAYVLWVYGCSHRVCQTCKYKSALLYQIKLVSNRDMLQTWFQNIVLPELKRSVAVYFTLSIFRNIFINLQDPIPGSCQDLLLGPAPESEFRFSGLAENVLVFCACQTCDRR